MACQPSFRSKVALQDQAAGRVLLPAGRWIAAVVDRATIAFQTKLTWEFWLRQPDAGIAYRMRRPRKPGGNGVFRQRSAA